MLHLNVQAKKEAPPRKRVVKIDKELQIVWGEVYAPDFPDSQGDFMTSDAIRDMAYNFMRKGDLKAIDTNHDQDRNGSYVVESFVAREGDPDFLEGSWVVGVKVPDPGVWQMIKSGELNGFSMDGLCQSEDTVLELDIPDLLRGETDDCGGHSHKFYVKFAEDGEFLGGCTEPAPDGHVHHIMRGTVTEDCGGHCHRFSFLEGVMNASPVN